MGVLHRAVRRDWNRWLGTELTGLRVQDLGERDAPALQQLVAARGVLVLRSQDLDIDSLTRFAALLGDIVDHPTSPHDQYPHAFRLHNDADSDYADGDNWHSDLTWMRSPPLYSVLMLDRHPPVGGDTAFVSNHALLQSMSARFRSFLATLDAVHQRNWNGGLLSAVHPMVVRHPVSGLSCLYANSGYTTEIEGLGQSESNAVLELLNSAVARGVDYQCRAVWEPGTVAVWDNQTVQHHASWDYHPETRSGWRVTAKASQPISTQ